jgi:type IV secretory pathway TraG/TraD family ATPase VirD4
MDELDSLGKVTSLRAGLTKLRKYGGACVSGLQTIAQLRDTYGREEAQTLLSCMSSKLILAAGDGETAEYFEKELGEQEVARVDESQSQSASAQGTSTSKNRNIRRDKQAAVLASEIQKLPNLHGFLKLVGLPIARVQLTYTAMPDVTAPFEPKKGA